MDNSQWHKYPDERPAEATRYEVYREGAGKQHYETWNGSGWAYNHYDITHWREILNPYGK